PFVLQTPEPSSSQTYSVALADYDLDGDLDLAVGNGAGHHNYVFSNEGALGTWGVFNRTNPAWQRLQAHSTRSLAWGNWDADEWPELAITGLHSEPTRVYDNDADGLTDVPSWLAGAVAPFADQFGDDDDSGD
ncbi:MAG TPA: hypothetical protein DIU15_03740, partial [Deltaproteobacteria bacterium]|nr:hypothetical protein [Deltaproteobacteria bacterium]